MRYEFKVFSLKEHETMPWCLIRDVVIREGSFECSTPGVAQQVQVCRWVKANFEHVSAQVFKYVSQDRVTQHLSPFSQCTWRDFVPTGEVREVGGVEIPQLHPSTFELEINFVKEGSIYECLKV